MCGVGELFRLDRNRVCVGIIVEWRRDYYSTNVQTRDRFSFFSIAALGNRRIIA